MSVKTLNLVISQVKFVVILSCFILTFVSSNSHDNKSAQVRLKDDPDLSEFNEFVERNQMAMVSFNLRSMTVFAPNNEAFSSYDGPDDDTIVLYHIANSALGLSQFGSMVSSELDGNPPLWVTRVKPPGAKEEQVYINDALILPRKSSDGKNEKGKKQFLHVIDKVLRPVLPNQSDLDIYNPDALQLLNLSESLNLGAHRLRTFRSRVKQMDKESVFSAEGRFTYFIPVDEGFEPSPRPGKVDGKVIDGHIIPNHVLFTTPTPDGQEYKTLAFTDMLKVTISFSSEQEGKTVKKYVKSNTVVGDSTHPDGVVIAEIVKANIPVRNGVVHLIHRPLMVVDTTVGEFLQSFKNIVQEDGPLYQFYITVKDHGGDFMDRINKMGELTLFAPSNHAWKDPNLRGIIQDKNRMREILNMHVVEQKLSMEKIIDSNVNQVPTLGPRKHLYFNVIESAEGNKTLTVEGGGVNATVLQPNIAATNGIVHMIDRVLGVPFTTVQMKLATDPMLNKTYKLGQATDFNAQLNDTTKRFTYFVPRDYAWSKMETRYPSAHKKLFMHDYSYHARSILERHLIIDDRAYSMADLKNFTQFEAKMLPTIRDIVKLKVKENEKSYAIEWNNEWISVFRPDVECTNGVIHVIDTVFARDSDIIVTGGSLSVTIVQPLHTAIGFLLCLFVSHYL